MTKIDKVGSSKLFLSSINLENPDQLLKGLMSGNLEGVENTGLKDLIGTVVSKLENKMTSGDINEEKLLNEANKMMGKFGLSKDMFENNARCRASDHTACSDIVAGLFLKGGSSHQVGHSHPTKDN